MSRSKTQALEDLAGRFTQDQLHRTARLYYMDGMAQGDVARLMSVSQPQVSRMLSLARELGIVQITVAEYDPRDRALEVSLRKLLKLKNVIVIGTVAGVGTQEIRQTIGHFAAPFTGDLLTKSRTIAIAGGRTLSSVIRQVNPPKSSTPVIVLQAMGQIGPTPDECDAMELGRILAARMGGTCQMLNTPAFFPDVHTRDTMAALDQIAAVTGQFRLVDTAFVGVGTLTNSVFVERHVLSGEERAQLEATGAVGEICGRYFDVEGRECATQLRERVISIPVEEVRRIPHVVAVVSGSDRTEALLAAVRGGLIKSLIIDDVGAAALAEAAAGKSPAEVTE